MKELKAAQLVKLSLIPGLGVVLYLVLPSELMPSKQSAPEPSVKSDSIAVTKPGSTSETLNNDVAIKGGLGTTQWPKFSLRQLEGNDPFDRRRIFPELTPTPTLADPTQREGVLITTNVVSARNRLEPSKIKAVFQSPFGNSALIGERVVRIGDRLEDGSEVISITPEELIVSSPGTN
jgi:hypothetical protein